MNTAGRIDAFICVLREALKAGLPSGYSDDNPTDKLITLTGNISDLCWEIAAVAKQADPANKIIMADSVKYNATNIINICVTELETSATPPKTRSSSSPPTAHSGSGISISTPSISWTKT